MSSTFTAAVCARYSAQVLQREQRKNFLSQLPRTRFEPVSPYAEGGPTPRQLSMRRKFEVLRYTQQSTASAVRRWTQLVSTTGAARRRVSPALASNPEYTVCDLVRLPGYYCNVPPARGDEDPLLFLDLAVPLYMLDAPLLDRPYSNFADLPAAAASPPMLSYQIPEAACDGAADLAALLFLPGVQTRPYAVTATVPLAVDLYGASAQYTAINGSRVREAGGAVAVSCSVGVYYNGARVCASAPAAAAALLLLEYPSSGAPGAPGAAASTHSWTARRFLGAVQVTVPAFNVAADAAFTLRATCSITYSAADFEPNSVTAKITANPALGSDGDLGGSDALVRLAVDPGGGGGGGGDAAAGSVVLLL